MRISVIVAVHDGTHTLGRCLDAIASSTRPADEVLVIDDGSSDGPAALANAHGVRLIRLEAPAHGPACARNQGAQQAQGEVLFFVDADVALHPDALAIAEQALSADPDLAACFGSYDDAPTAPGLVSQYRNLMHHYVHQHANEDAATFWAGCGAIRKHAYTSVGGFCEQYGRPSVEDIELGARLRAAGMRIRLLKAMQGTHLKRWTLGSVIRTDIRDRALPWSRVLVRSGRLPNDLNLRTPARWSALCALALPVVLIAGAWRPALWLLALPLMAALLALNADLYAMFVRLRGPGFAVGAILLHWLYYLYSALTFGLVAARHWLARYGLVVLLLATLAKNLLGAALLPPLRGPDERYHFWYGQAIERFGSVDKAPQDMVAEEVALLWSLVSRENLFSKDWAPQQQQTVVRQLTAAKSENASSVYISGRPYGLRLQDFPQYHPPLYHLLIGGAQWLLESRGITVRVLASRLVSAALGLLTVWLIYRLALLLWPEHRGVALCAATIASFHRRFTLFSTLISNTALETALFALLLYLCALILRRGSNWRRLLALACALTLGLLARVSFAAAVPIVALLFGWEAYRVVRRHSSIRALAPWLLVALIPLAGAGWWYRDLVFSGAENLLGLYGQVSPRARITLFGFVLRTQWAKRWLELLLNYWGPTPTTVTALLSVSSGVTTLALGLWLLRRIRSNAPRADAGTLVALALCALATLSVDAFNIYVEYRYMRAHGGPWGTRPAYYLAPFAGQMLCYAFGWALVVPKRRTVLLRLAATAAVALQLWTVLCDSMPSTYGAGLLRGLQRAALLQGFSEAAMLALFVGYLVLCGALLLTVWSTTDASAADLAT